MNYSRSNPDWQQYNALQSGSSEGTATNIAAASVGQNINPNHSFVSSVSPSSTGNIINSDCMNKMQNDVANFGTRNYPPGSSGPSGSNNCGNMVPQSPLSSMMHMYNCINHYNNSSNMNPMMEDMNSDGDHRRNQMPEDVTHRNNMMSMNGTINHMVGPNMNVNNNMTAGSRVSLHNSRHASYVSGPCKGPCCIPNPSINYNYNSYPPGAPYRENVHMLNYNSDDRKYRSNTNYRKDVYPNKTSNINNQYHTDQRKNYSDFKYRKDSRIYNQPSVMLPNCGMQSMVGDYSMYHHCSVRGGNHPPMTTPPNTQSGMIKIQEPLKHPQYQNNNMVQNMMPNNIPPMQNSYYNNQQINHKEFVSESRDVMDPSNMRIQPPSGPYAKHHMYRQKFAIQRITLENQLKEMTRVPGFLSNPKYQESFLRYRELCKLQKTMEFQSTIQESSINPNSNIGPPISPINLQFDHNGILINSNYLPTNYSALGNQTFNSNSNCVALDKSSKTVDGVHQQNMQLVDQTTCVSGPQNSSTVSQNMCPSGDQQNDFQVPQELQSKPSKDFADKPDLDVRQFLATWDETEEEENAVASVVSGKDPTPVTVVEFTNLNLVTNMADAQKEFNLIQSNPTIQGNNAVDINKVVSVVGCINSDGNNVPTIHIVDDLQNKIVVGKIDSVLSKINNGNINCVQELVKKDILSNNQKQISEKCPVKVGQMTENLPLTAKSPAKNNVEISGTKNSVSNVELNTSDDLSLPDLPTYECTTLSTSLNTPVHSDNEESLEKVAHLTMSANPIEVVQNSPIISFTQTTSEGSKSKDKSPLNFDLVSTNEVIKNFLPASKSDIKSANKEVQPSLSLPAISDNSEIISKFNSTSEIKKSNKLVDEPNVCDKIIQQFYSDTNYFNSTSIPLIPGEENEEPRIPVSPMEGNCLTKIIRNTSPITNINVLGSDDELDKEDEIWKEIANIDKNVDSSLSTDLEASSKEKQFSTHKLKKLLKHSRKSKNKVDLKKIKHLLKSDLRKHERSSRKDFITDSLKTHEDSSTSSQSSDSNSKVINSRCQGTKDYRKTLFDDKHRRHGQPRTKSKENRWRSKSAEPIIINSDNESDLLREFKKLKRKRSIGSSTDRKEVNKVSLSEKVIQTKDKQQEKEEQVPQNLCLSSTMDRNNVEEENKLVKHDSNKEFEIQLTNLNFRINNDLHKDFLSLKDEKVVTKDKLDGIKIEINLSCSENKKISNVKSKSEDNIEDLNLINNELKADDENISTCNNSSTNLNSVRGSIESSSTKHRQIVTLPQSVKKESANKRNEILPHNVFECLTSRIADNLPGKSASDLTKKPTSKVIDIMDVKDQLKLSNNPLNFKVTDDIYNSKTFEYPKESLRVYNIQNLEKSQLSSSLHVTNPVSNMDCTNPYTGSKSCFDKMLSYNFDKADTLAYKNPLTFKNYCSESSFKDRISGKDSGSPSGFFNPAFMDDIDKMNKVPVYTTKDGKIKYSPNSKYTYKKLLVENGKPHDTPVTYKHRYHSKSKDKKKRKSKHVDGKLHKSESHKHELVINKLSQSIENEPVRDCSVIAIAPSNIFTDRRPSLEVRQMDDNNIILSTEDGNNEKKNFDVAANDDQLMTIQNNSFQEIPFVNEEGHNMDNENRSTVIKQLGMIPDDLKRVDMDNQTNAVAATKGCEIENIEYNSVIQIDNSSAETSIVNYNTCNHENEHGAEVHSKSTSIVSPATVLTNNSLVKENVAKRSFPQNVILKQSTEKKIPRRHSTSVIECSKSDARSRRKSFESDIIITSVFHDSKHYLREDAITETRSTVTSGDNDFENNDECVTENKDKNTSVPVIITETVPTNTKNEQRQSNPVVESETALISKAELVSSENKTETISVSTEFVNENNHIDNISKPLDVELKKIEILSKNPFCKERLEIPSQVYSNYQSVIIKEERDLEQNRTISDFEKDPIPIIDREVVLPPLERIEFDKNYNNQSDDESVECPKLENQLEQIPEITQEMTFKASHKCELESICFKNEFAKEVDDSTSTVLNVTQDSFKVSSCKNVYQSSTEDRKVIPKLVIRKTESSPKIVSQSDSSICPIIQSNFDDKSNESKSASNLQKIPKMIIRNVNSRPQTPIIEEVPTCNIRTLNSDSKSLKSKSNKSEDRNKRSYDIDTKVPKMKINLENDMPKVVVDDKSKTIPKMTIRKIYSQAHSIADESMITTHRSRSSESQKSDADTKESSRDKLPKFKIQKEHNSSKRSRSSSSQSSSKRFRKCSKNYEESSNLSEYECNTNDMASIADKIPKVIIKRMSTRSEFKCQLSESKTKALEWQPRVTLNRSWILDTMAKELRHMKVALKLTTPKIVDPTYAQNNVDPNKLKWDKFLSDLKKQNKMSSSNSDIISFDITTSTSRKSKNVLSITQQYSGSEDSDSKGTSSVESSHNKEIRSDKRIKENEEYISEDPCFDDISSVKIKQERDNDILVHCPNIDVVENNDSCTKMNTFISQKLHFDITQINDNKQVDVKNNDNEWICMKEKNESKNNFIIEVESSDESQTTIEILPASPDLSTECFDSINKTDEKTCSRSTVPKVGLEIQINESKLDNNKKVKRKMYKNTDVKAMDENVTKRRKIEEKRPSSRSHYSHSKHGYSKLNSNHHKDDKDKKLRQSSKFHRNELSYSDLLAKEVLAAKETLKRCFMKCPSANSSTYNNKIKTVKKETYLSFNSNNVKRSNDRSSSNDGNRKELRLPMEERLKKEKYSKRRSKSRSRSCSKSKFSTLPNHEQRNISTISLKEMKKALKNSDKAVPNDVKNLMASETTNRYFVDSVQKAMQAISQKELDKNTSDSEKSLDESEKKDSSEDNMPVLEPQVNVELAPIPDRDTSMSPPVITPPDSIDANLNLPKEEPLQFDFYQNESHVKKDMKFKEESEMTIAEIVRELAFHEKATIKHQRYCTLCERWFSSVMRHEKHLSGYQHRHTELMQRRTIHALYTLFTGKPCPKLLPANVLRIDCSLGEPTPLQIVVQDIVIDCDDMHSGKKIQEV